MEDFRRVVDDLALTNVKLDRGWFTWSNNKRGHGLVKERLDRFFVSTSWLDNNPFLASSVIKQANSDHDVVMLDTLGRVPKAGMKDPRLLFRYEACWSNDGDAKEVVKDVLMHGYGDVLRGVENMRSSLGRWQFDRYNDRKGRIDTLICEINSIMDRLDNDQGTERLCHAWKELSNLYNAEEKYWAQRTRIRWLRKGDRNMRYFHVRAFHLLIRIV